MAKKKRNRIWWFALTAKEYTEISKTRKLPVPIVLFDKQEMAYAQGYGNRFDPAVDADGNRVIVDGYQQLTHSGKITVMGIRGEFINWKKGLVSERSENGTGELVLCDQPIDLTERAVYQVLAESDEQLLMHLQSPMARAGGIVPPASLVERVNKKKLEAAALAAAAAKEAEKLGEDEGTTTDAAASEDGECAVESGADTASC